MKPYLYILIVLLVGGSIGFFIGRQSTALVPSIATPPETTQSDSDSIQRILERQEEAYRLHDALLLMRDREQSFVEIDGNSGRSYDLAQTLIYYHEQFRSGKSVRLQINEPEVSIKKNSAVVRAHYAKTSDMYADQGYESVVGEGLWLLTKNGGIWRVTVFFRTESFKH